jgi:hypothetical protein
VRNSPASAGKIVSNQRKWISRISLKSTGQGSGGGGDFSEDFQCPPTAVLDLVGGDERIVVELG